MFSLKREAQEWANNEYKARIQEDQGTTPETAEFQLSIQTIEMLLAESQKNCFLTVFHNDEDGNQQSFILEADGDVMWLRPEEAQEVAQLMMDNDPELLVTVTNIDEV